VVAGVAWYLIARDTPEEHPFVSAEEMRTIRAGLTEVPLAKSGVPWSAILRSRTLLLLTFACFCFGYIAWIFLGWFYLYMAQAHGVDLKTSALYTMIPFIAITVFCLAGGVLGDWIAARHGLRAGRCAPGFFSLLVAAGLLIMGSRVGSAPVAAITLGYGGYRGSACRRSVGRDEYGSADRRGGHRIAHAVDCAAIWMDLIVPDRGPGGSRGCDRMAWSRSGNQDRLGRRMRSHCMRYHGTRS